MPRVMYVFSPGEIQGILFAMDQAIQTLRIMQGNCERDTEDGAQDFTDFIQILNVLQATALMFRTPNKDHTITKKEG